VQDHRLFCSEERARLRITSSAKRKMPKHACCVELFGGAAHVTAQKTPVTNEVYYDINGEVVNFLLVARNEPKRLREAYDLCMN
jgi:site-specific DNA-adenine methylase